MTDCSANGGDSARENLAVFLHFGGSESSPRCFPHHAPMYSGPEHPSEDPEKVPEADEPVPFPEPEVKPADSRAACVVCA
jgi:hypothetical protein